MGPSSLVLAAVRKYQGVQCAALGPAASVGPICVSCAQCEIGRLARCDLLGHAAHAQKPEAATAGWKFPRSRVGDLGRIPGPFPPLVRLT